MLTNRQKDILNIIVEHYTDKAQAVSSELLAQALGVSSATIRNDMAAMTEDGFLMQPHTSAGRIPSEKGWQYYIAEFLDQDQSVPQKELSALEEVLKSHADKRLQSKALAKHISALSNNAVIVAFSPRDVYYTGLTNLFSQPEFHEMQSVVHISQVIDHLDDVIVNIFEAIDDITIAIGRQNPFSPECSVVMTNVMLDDTKGLISILGPMRMRYDHNYALLKTIRDLV
ncbi:MAG: HTH domain-containing protein [Patescibacteria group bacterium]